jgi:hypothetical protein
MSLKRNLTLLVAMLGTLTVVSCSQPMGNDSQLSHTCNQEQAGCSGD